MTGVAWAGPLSRWYARGGGDLAKLRAGVEAWRADLRAAVAAKVAAELRWDEAAEVTFTADLGESGLAALRLFAMYAERPDLELPDRVPRVLELDREWRAASDGKFARSVYGQVVACEVWLPGEFPVTVKVPMPDGVVAEVGSVGGLRDQLQWLNERTFAAGADEVAGWRGLGAPVEGRLLDAARRGFAGLWAAVGMAVRERVPVVVRDA